MKTTACLGSLACLVLLASVAAGMSACASAPVGDGATGSTASPVAASRTEPAPDLTGTWAFALASSDVAAPLRDECARKSDSDTAKARACWDEVSSEAAKEKIRFAKDDAGKLTWTSFGTDGAKETVFLQIPIEVQGDGPGHVLAKIAGAPKGTMARKIEGSRIDIIRFELVDARTIAMVDPRKGRLVYTKE